MYNSMLTSVVLHFKKVSYHIAKPKSFETATLRHGGHGRYDWKMLDAVHAVHKQHGSCQMNIWNDVTCFSLCCCLFALCCSYNSQQACSTSRLAVPYHGDEYMFLSLFDILYRAIF